MTLQVELQETFILCGLWVSGSPSNICQDVTVKHKNVVALEETSIGPAAGEHEYLNKMAIYLV